MTSGLRAEYKVFSRDLGRTWQYTVAIIHNSTVLESFNTYHDGLYRPRKKRTAEKHAQKHAVSLLRLAQKYLEEETSKGTVWP